jgi:integrase
MRFSDFAPQWLQNKRDDLAKSSIERYVNGLAHASARFGEYFMDALDADDIEAWLDQQIRKGAAPATVNGYLRILRCFFDGAIRARIRQDNPARMVRARKEGRTRGRRGKALTAEQLGRFIGTTEMLIAEKAITPDVGRLLLVLAWTGMRRGEAFALRWSDLVEGELHVARSISYGMEKCTKTDDPRIVGIPEPLARVLADQKAWLHETEHRGLFSGLMFPASARHAVARARRTEKPIVWFRAGSCLDKPLRIILERAGLPAISPHSFRRTYENLLRRAGVDEHVRRTVAGWRSTDTQAIYASVDPSERAQAAASMTKLVMPSVTLAVTLGGQEAERPAGAATPTGQNE